MFRLGLWFSVALTGCVSTGAADALEQPRATPVRVQPLVELEHGPRLTLHGVTRSVDRASLSFPSGGRLERRSVRVGDTVKRGEALAQVETAVWRHQLQAQAAGLQQVEVQLAQVERERARLQPLAGNGSVALAELERIEAQRDGALAQRHTLRAQVADAERQLANAVLTAPFAGVVAAVMVEPGESVAAGQPVVEIVGAAIEVPIEVPEDIWVKLHPQLPVQVVLPALDLQTPGQIVDLGGSAGTRGLFPVVVRIPGGERRVAGLTARVVLQMPLEPGLVVPLGAIVDPIGAGPSVYVVRGGQAERVRVELGALTPAGVVVRGLPKGSEVVVAGQSSLNSGARVEVQRD